MLICMYVCMYVCLYEYMSNYFFLIPKIAAASFDLKGFHTLNICKCLEM